MTRALAAVASIAWLCPSVAFGQRAGAAGCEQLQLSEYDRLLAIEWRDPSIGQTPAARSTVELACDPRSVRVTVRSEDRSIVRERAVDVAEREWSVAPRIVALVTAQLVAAVEREREERVRSALEERPRVAEAPARPAVVAPRPCPEERLWIEGGASVRVRQFDALWWSLGPRLALSLRVRSTPLWLGLLADGEASVRAFSLGAVRFARVHAGPSVTLASASHAPVSFVARGALLIGAQSLWATTDRATVEANALVAASLSGSFTAALALRLSSSLSLSLGADAAIELVSLSGGIDAMPDVRTDGLSLGGSLSLLWRG